MDNIKQIPTNDLLREADRLLHQLDHSHKYDKLFYLFPDVDNSAALHPNKDNKKERLYARSKYVKMLQFFEAGGMYKFRLLMAANQVGKTTCLMFEFTCHLIGWYPSWWTGKRFNRAVKGWVVGDRSKTVKNLSDRLLGEVGVERGSGFIPKKHIDFSTLTEATTTSSIITEFRAKSNWGGYSNVEFKTSESGRKAFESETVDIIIMDEEPPQDVYGECVTRLVASGGILMMNFTPMMGATDVVNNFCGNDWTDGAKSEYSYMIGCDWEDVPHLDDDDKAAILSQTPEYLKIARSKGIPLLGAGAVFKTPWEEIEVEPFEIPKHWRRSFAMDFGWKTTAILWQAIDPDSNVTYWTHEYYAHEKEVIFHAQMIKQIDTIAGFKIPGCCDPAAGPSQVTGISVRSIMDTEFNINMISAQKDEEVGLFLMNHKLETGQIKAFKTLQNLRKEYKAQMRDTDGKIKQCANHLVDCARYNTITGIKIADNTEHSHSVADQILQFRNQQDVGWNIRDGRDWTR